MPGKTLSRESLSLWQVLDSQSWKRYIVSLAEFTRQTACEGGFSVYDTNGGIAFSRLLVPDPNAILLADTLPRHLSPKYSLQDVASIVCAANGHLRTDLLFHVHSHPRHLRDADPANPSIQDLKTFVQLRVFNTPSFTGGIVYSEGCTAMRLLLFRAPDIDNLGCVLHPAWENYVRNHPGRIKAAMTNMGIRCVDLRFDARTGQVLGGRQVLAPLYP
jgi:hypothetical protein